MTFTPVKMEVSASECSHLAAAVWLETTTNLAVIALRINMASFPTETGSQLDGWPERLLTKWYSKGGKKRKTDGPDWTDQT